VKHKFSNWTELNCWVRTARNMCTIRLHKCYFVFTNIFLCQVLLVATLNVWCSSDCTEILREIISATLLLLPYCPASPSNSLLRLNVTALLNKSSHSFKATLAIWDHTAPSNEPASRHNWTRPAKQAGTWFTYPRGIEGWVDLGGWLHTEMVYLSADNHTSK